jgi:hypothetical protein
MKKIFAVILALALCLGVGGCSSDSTSTSTSGGDHDSVAAYYLGNNSDEEILQHFEPLAYYDFADFDDPAQLTTDELYRFVAFMFADEITDHEQEEVNADGVRFTYRYVPVDKVTSLLDGYFADYSFVPEELSVAEYDPDTQMIKEIAAGGGTGNLVVEFGSAQATGADTIEVVLNGLTADGKEPVFNVTFTAKIADDGEAKILTMKKEQIN